MKRMGIMDILMDPIGTIERTNSANERQDTQWQVANQALADAVEAINNENHQTAIAFALVGLLSLQLSRT